MKDILFDFVLNDIVLVGSDIAITENVSQQNATLILAKSCVNPAQAQYGAAFEEVYANISQNNANLIASDAKRQILNDGATGVSITLTQQGLNNTKVDVTANYGV